MIDKDGNIGPKETKWKKWYSVIKENTAQITITIPIVMVICAYVIQLFSYILERGYYRYFGIEASFMLTDNKINMYQLILKVVLITVYLLFTTFAAHIFTLKKNIFWKIVCFLLIPVSINILIGYSVYGKDISILTLVIIGIIFILPHWFMMFGVGYFIIMPFFTKKEVKENSKKKEDSWSEIHYKLLGLLMICVGVILFFCWGYIVGNTQVSDQKRYGIVNINEVTYAVIDANEDKLILQECEIEQTTLKIDRNTYLCTNNEVLINFQTFDNVEVEYK